MQIIYAYKTTAHDDIVKEQKFLLFSINNMYNLYLLLLSLITEIQKKAETHLEASKKKHLATAAEKNPNLKFINNAVLQLLVNNEPLKQAFELHKINNWQLDNEYVDSLYRTLVASPLYKDYMAETETSFNADRDFVASVFKDIIAPDQKLYEYLEDKSLTWLDDLPTINTTLLKVLKKVKQNSPDTVFSPELYKDESDKEYAVDLLKKTILNQTDFDNDIEEHASNWDVQRIAKIDMVILKMALCEFQKFSSIPTKVTINEYLEIAKEYSTPKSSIFINGILDKLVKKYEKEGTLNKVGRGLM